MIFSIKYCIRIGIINWKFVGFSKLTYCHFIHRPINNQKITTHDLPIKHKPTVVIFLGVSCEYVSSVMFKTYLS